MNISLGHEAPGDAWGIESLLDSCFGPDRHLKTCQRLRDGQLPAAGLSLVARDEQDGAIVGTLRFWDVLVGGRTPTLLLGPLAVDPARQSGGLGSRLMRLGLAEAAARGHKSVILVGDEPYYRRFGFERRVTEAMDLPGPVDRDRFLGLEFAAGALADAKGLVTPATLPVILLPVRRRAAPAAFGPATMVPPAA